MPSSFSALVFLPAVAGLILARPPICAAERDIIWISTCGEQASRPLPFKQQRPAPDRDCPVACHAACPRKDSGEAESG